MLRTLLVLMMLGGAVMAAQAQLQPRVLSPATPPVEVAEVPLVRIAPPLSREEAETLRQRLRSSLQQQSAAAPRSNALRSAGLHPESDAVEQADTAERAQSVGPVGVGLAEKPQGVTSVAVDPALAEVARLQLRARLNRDPTAAEMTTELRDFDARVARANEWLDVNRKRIAKTYASAGTLPPTFDNAAQGVEPPDRGNDTPAVRQAFRALFRVMLTEPDPTTSTTTLPTIDNGSTITPPATIPGVPVQPRSLPNIR